jgi:hypothetical protein
MMNYLKPYVRLSHDAALLDNSANVLLRYEIINCLNKTPTLCKKQLAPLKMISNSLEQASASVKRNINALTPAKIPST